ncbi:MAG TPA: DNA mismatch repair endonuclease MutL [Vicinamibacterales bacterium]|nr:DNA mismatch repair endonuclease MutL [Vicinamibacterales bacterium]
MAVTRIVKLPDDLANQIAAGEVVERPASVVKELVENALDAEARRIHVAIEYGGKRLLRVEDDGLGMGPEDARLSLERHATSKIRTVDDLAAIATLGFRGEALPSIASVSRFTLRTRARGAPGGTEIHVVGGAVERTAAVGAPEGTAITVEDLFFNMPARRKFLKSDGAESAHVSKLMTQMALCHPGVGFTLTSGGKRLLECPPAATLADRIYQIYGDRPDLVPVARETHGVRVSGLVAALADTGPTRGPQHVFVNHRIVKDKTIAHAIIDAYASASIKERSPELHLFLEVPLDRVDVNVHPTKAEVRFADQSLIHELVRRGVAEALGTARMPDWPVGAAPPSYRDGTTAAPGGGEGASRAGGEWSWAARERASSAWSGPSPTEWRPRAPQDIAGFMVDDATSAVGLERVLTPLGQFRNTFIIAADDDGLVIIDQHVAHERVLFERILERLTRSTLDSQRLLVPMVLDLPGAGHHTLLARGDALARFGFEIEEFGGVSVRVTAVPAILNLPDIDRTLRALADDLEGLDRGLVAEHAVKQIAATMACHAAVRAHDPLTTEKMSHILEELRATAYSTVCPHGRPVMFRLSRRELERRFERI